MMSFKKIAANANGKLIVAYLRENKLEPRQDIGMATDPAADTGRRLNAYYTGRDGRGAWMSDMGSRIADALGVDLSRPPSDKTLERLVTARRADTGTEWEATKGRKREISAYDLTFSPDKSVTLAAEFAGTAAEQGVIWIAIHSAAEAAMRLVASEVGQARRTVNGEMFVEQGEVAWIAFRHYTARPTLDIQDGYDGVTARVEVPVPGDPQAHIHHLLLNIVATESGHLGSLDSQRITDTTAHLYGAYFQAILAQRLRELGIAVHVDERGRAVRISAIPEHARDAFSKRHHDTEARAKSFAKAQGREWAGMSADEKYRVLYETNLRYRQAKYDGGNEREIWREMAAAIGWSHDTVLTEAPAALRPRSDRLEEAYAIAAKMIAEEFKTAAVIDHDVLRLHAAHGLIAAGIEDAADITRVVDMVEARGLQIEGEQSVLHIRERHGRVRVTNSRQLRVEREVEALLKEAVAAQGGALSVESIRAAIGRSNLDFQGNAIHGQAQLNMIHHFGRAKQIAFLMGVAGSGKTAMLSVLSDAWHQDGRKVFGAAMAWQQAENMKGAGLDGAFAMTKLLNDLDRGRLALDSRSVLVIDEVSQVAPEQMLRLLQHQKQMGFALRLIGDREQGQAIGAGDAVELLLRHLPPEVTPEILTTVRQRDARDRTIAGMFRSNGRDVTISEDEQRQRDVARVGEALAMKRTDGAVSLVGGDLDQVVTQIAEFYLRRREVLAAGGAKRGITISVPTNEDAALISLAIRDRLKARGELTGPERVIAAVDQRGQTFDLPIVQGDRVRLFDRIYVPTPNGYGRTTFGSNGDFVTVLGWDEKTLRLRNRHGVEATISLDALRDPTGKTDRTRLGFGYAMTIDSAQGITSDEHINAMPRGTGSMTGFRAYVAESRHILRCWTMISEAALREAEEHSRPLGDPTPVTIADLWERAIKDLARHEYKALGIDLLASRKELERIQTLAAKLAERRERMFGQKRDPSEEYRNRAATREVAAVEPAVLRDLGYSLRKTGHELREALERQTALRKAEEARARQSELERQQEQERGRGPAPAM